MLLDPNSSTLMQERLQKGCCGRPVLSGPIKKDSMRATPLRVLTLEDELPRRVFPGRRQVLFDVMKTSGRGINRSAAPAAFLRRPTLSFSK